MAINPYDPKPFVEAGVGSTSTPWYIYLEDALILLAIPVLWFTVLNMSGPLVTGIQVVTLLVLIVIGFNRARRLLLGRRRAEDAAKRL